MIRGNSGEDRCHGSVLISGDGAERPRSPVDGRPATVLREAGAEESKATPSLHDDGCECQLKRNTEPLELLNTGRERKRCKGFRPWALAPRQVSRFAQPTTQPLFWQDFRLPTSDFRRHVGRDDAPAKAKAYHLAPNPSPLAPNT